MSALHAQPVEFRVGLRLEAEQEEVVPRESGVLFHEEDEVLLDRYEIFAHHL